MKANPSVTIVKSPSILAEIILRVIVILFCLGTLIVSAITLNHIESSLPPSISPSINELIRAAVNIDYNSLLFNSRTAAQLGIAISVVTLVYEVLIIILRFLNVGFINSKIKIFLIIDVVIAFALAVAIAIAGILAAQASATWVRVNGTIDTILRFLIPLGISVSVPEVLKARDLLGGTAGLGLGTALMISLLMVWVLFTVIQRCCKK